MRYYRMAKNNKIDDTKYYQGLMRIWNHCNFDTLLVVI